MKIESEISPLALSPIIQQALEVPIHRPTISKEILDKRGLVIDGYEHPDGYFWFHVGKEKQVTEASKTAPHHYKFAETKRDKEHVYIRDASRNIDFRITLKEGKARSRLTKAKLGVHGIK